MAKIDNPVTIVQSGGSGAKAKIKTGTGLFINSTEIAVGTEALDVSGVTSMTNMFTNCSNLISVDVSEWDVSHVSSMKNLFARCYSLLSLDLHTWDTSALTDASYIVQSCSSLATLNMSGWDLSNITAASDFVNPFANCPALVNFTAPTFYLSVSFSTSTLLSHDSLMSIINNLATVSTAETLTLGSTNLAKLTAAEIAIATDKGWTVA